MKVFISADMEGLAGVSGWEQVTETHPEYRLTVELFLKEVNAAVEGAMAGGAKEILVNDSHAGMRNLPIEQLNPGASLIQGNLKPLSMVQGVEGGCDLAFFLGYHAGVGSPAAICDHSYSSRSLFQVKWNGQTMSEAALNAAVCGHFQVPVGLVSGDRETVRQAQALFPGIATVSTKEGISRFAACHRHPLLVREEIRQKAKWAVQHLDQACLFQIKPPVEMEVTFADTARADLAGLVPGTIRQDGRSVVYQAPGILAAFSVLQVFLLMARSLPA
jgi:D-amino peptidase